MSCADQPDGQGDEAVVMPRRKRVFAREKGVCQRCRASKCLYIVRSVTMCRACFETAVRASVVKALHPPLLPADARSAQPFPRPSGGDVLVALSAGAGSSALADLVSERYIGREGRELARGQREPVWARGWAVHVDFSGVTGLESRAPLLDKLAEERGLRFVCVRAEDAFDPLLRRRVAALAGVGGVDGAEGEGVVVRLDEPDLPLLEAPSSSTATPLESLQALLASLPPPSRPALLSHILDGLLGVVAQALPNITHLLIGETSTREAQRVIAGTATGRGWALPVELAAAAPLPRAGRTIMRIKAMKNVSLKEAAIWCHGRGVQTYNERRWDGTGGGARRDARGKGATASIEALTERFIAGLNVSHPSTVTTINKTGDKLCFVGDANSAPLCPVCQLPVDASATDWKARSALTSLPGKGDGVAAAPSPDPLAPLLCYACLTMFTPLTAAQKDRPTAEPVPLPLWVGARVQERRHVTPQELRDEVAQFLIDDDEEGV
ncbi:Cytoplasmic tRNA 2-thiolation protein 2 [Vanrija albida]|uniref:Cytoplasmic tRNA 2-thiolation protein 2 n=1 Tax=Vanrija albida TaxID=181172 RepID=A0ABR3PRN8_9TREE